MLQLTTQWSSLFVSTCISYHSTVDRGYGHPTAQSLIRSTKSVVCCRVPGSTVSTILIKQGLVEEWLPVALLRLQNHWASYLTVALLDCVHVCLRETWKRWPLWAHAVVLFIGLQRVLRTGNFNFMVQICECLYLRSYNGLYFGVTLIRHRVHCGP